MSVRMSCADVDILARLWSLIVFMIMVVVVVTVTAVSGLLVDLDTVGVTAALILLIDAGQGALDSRHSLDAIFCHSFVSRALV